MARDATKLTTPRQASEAGAGPSSDTEEEVARPRGAPARRAQEAAGSPRAHRAGGGAGAALAGTAMAAVAGTATSQELTVLTATHGQATNAVVILMDDLNLVWVFGLGKFVMTYFGLLIVAAAVGACACWCRRSAETGASNAQGPGGEEEVTTPADKLARRVKRAKRTWTDAGVQGPVHYDGKKHVHRSQGFSRGDEVTRLPAAKAHHE